MSRGVGYGRSNRVRDKRGGIVAVVTRRFERWRSGEGSRLTVRRWIVLALGGFGLLSVSTLATGSGTAIPWYAATVGTAVAMVLVCRGRWGRHAVRWVLGAYAVALPVLTILAGFDLWSPWGSAVRVSLFTANPNLLGADLVAVAAAMLAISPRRWWALWLPVVALAVILTGSRTALLALLVVVVVWLFGRNRSWRLRLGVLGGLSGLFLLLLAANVQATERAKDPNLLHTSVTFQHEVWRTGYARSITIQPGVIEGPFEGTDADRVRGTSDDHTLVIYQGVERSIEGEPYVASVYLRAEEPQVVVLSTHLSRARCHVDRTWSRCVTPVGEGNGKSAAQFRLETEEVGGTFDVYVYGPQFERSDSVSPYDEAVLRPLSGLLMQRFRLDSIVFVDPTRLAAMGVGLEAFAASPAFGLGTRGLDEALSGADPSLGVRHLGHTHSLWVERLATEGVVGVIGWLLVIGTALVAVGSDGRARLLPLLAGLLVLNSLDMTFFHAGSYLGLWAAVAISWQRDITA